MVRYLVEEHQLDIKYSDNHCLSLAAESNNKNLVSYILENYENLNVADAVYEAAKIGNIEILKILLDYDPKNSDFHKNTVIDAIKNSEFVSSFKELLKIGVLKSTDIENDWIIISANKDIDTANYLINLISQK